jgi:hypothetical protein
MTKRTANILVKRPPDPLAKQIELQIALRLATKQTQDRIDRLVKLIDRSEI